MEEIDDTYCIGFGSGCMQAFLTGSLSTHSLPMLSLT